MGTTRHFVARLPDGREFGFDCPDWRGEPDVARVAHEAVSLSGLTTPRRAPEPVAVDLYELHIKRGKLVPLSIGRRQVVPPLAAMTEEEYVGEMRRVLAALPEAFRAFVANEAHDRGHHAGRDEVAAIAAALAEAIKGPIAAYKRELLAAAAPRPIGGGA